MNFYNISFVFAFALSASVATSSAQAHFKLLKPASWLNEGGGGDPQKGSPCGPGGYDDKQPPPVSGAITTFHAGETISVEWVDTIAHPGYFRIALAADRSMLKDPTISQGADCSFDESMLPKGAHDNVLADGIFFRSRTGFSDAAGKMFSQQITLPNEPCEKCTLQVVQVMENDVQALSRCYYFHCADIKIVPAGAEIGSPDADAGASLVDAAVAVGDAGVNLSDAGDSAVAVRGTGSDAGLPVADASATSAFADSGAAQPAGSKDDGGCSVRRVGAQTAGAPALALSFLVAFGLVLRRRKRA